LFQKSNSYPQQKSIYGVLHAWIIATVFVFFSLYFLSVAMTILSPIIISTYDGDLAITEMDVINAMHGHLLLGPYSRVGFHHPGPLFSYLTVPLYSLLGVTGILITALCIHFISVVTILVCSLRAAGKKFFLCNALFIALLLYSKPQGFFLSYWCPFVTVLAFGAFVFVCLQLSRGSLRALPYIVIAGSFLCQEHVLYVPVVAICFFLCAWIYCAYNSGELRKQKLVFYASASLAFVLWLPVLYQQFFFHDGNISKIVQYFMSAPFMHPPVKEIIRVVFMSIALIPQAFWHFLGNPVVSFTIVGFDHLSLAPNIFITVGFIQCVAAALGFIIFRRHTDRYVASIGILLAALLGIALVSLYNIREPFIRHYLVTWISILSLLSLSCLALFFFLIPFARLLPVHLRRSAAVRLPALKVLGGVLVLALLCAVLIQSMPPFYWFNKQTMGKKVTVTNPLCETVYQFLAARKEKPLIFVDGSAWVTAAEIVSYVHRKNVPFYINNEMLSVFGSQFKKSGGEPVDTVYITNCEQPLQNGLELIVMSDKGLDGELKPIKIYAYYVRKGIRSQFNFDTRHIEFP